MLRNLDRNSRIRWSFMSKGGQAISAEYILVIFIVLGMMAASTIYFRRAMQARIHDARETMLNIVFTRVGNDDYAGNLYREYEPYYTNRASVVRQDIREEERVLPSFNATSGIYRKDEDHITIREAQSETLPPKDAEPSAGF